MTKEKSAIPLLGTISHGVVPRAGKYPSYCGRAHGGQSQRPQSGIAPLRAAGLPHGQGIVSAAVNITRMDPSGG